MMLQNEVGAKSSFLQKLDLSFRLVPLAFIMTWICQATYAIILRGPFTPFKMFGLDIFSDIFNVGSGTLHASTALVGFSFWIFIYILLRKKPAPVQITMASAMPVLGLFLYDFYHAVCTFFLMSRANPLIQLVLVATCFLLIYFYNQKYKFLKVNKFFLVLLGLYFLISAALVYSGFFTQLRLYETVGGPNPHKELWLASKIISVWLWSGIMRIES